MRHKLTTQFMIYVQKTPIQPCSLNTVFLGLCFSWVQLWTLYLWLCLCSKGLRFGNVPGFGFSDSEIIWLNGISYNMIYNIMWYRRSALCNINACKVNTNTRICIAGLEDLKVKWCSWDYAWVISSPCSARALVQPQPWMQLQMQAGPTPSQRLFAK